MKAVLRRASIIALALILALALCSCDKAAPASGAADEHALTAYFIDVGQGDSALVLCGGQALLIDAGTEKSAQKLVDFIKSLGIKKLDYVVATHPHADHIGGMEAVLNTFEVGVFLMPEATHTTATFERMLDAVAENGCTAEYTCEGYGLSLGGASISALSPPEGESFNNLNNYSAVLSVEYMGRSLLFMGDAEGEIEARLLKSGIGSYDILKAGHHGSRTSSGAEFIATVSPAYAVICCGAGNEYGHPHAEVLERLAGADVLRTDLNGTITVTVSGGEINVLTEKAVRP